jgi:hypothetical protein
MNRRLLSIAAIVLFSASLAMAATPEEQKVLAAAKRTYESLTATAYETGAKIDMETLYVWSHRWLDAELQVANSAKEKLAAYTAHLDRMKPHLDFMVALVQAGTRDATTTKLNALEYYVVEADMWVQKAKSDDVPAKAK